MMISSRLEQACKAPDVPWMPLRVAAQRCGWILPETVACLQEAGSRLDQDESGVDILAALGETCLADCHGPVTNWLSAAAQVLHQAGLIKTRRAEHLDVLSPEGQCLGEIERSAVRAFGLRTRAVHLNAWSSDGRLWVARRALNKNTDPGKWDTLVGGLVSAGESPRVAMLRESWEEAGLTPSQLTRSKPSGKCLVQRPLPEGFQVEEVLVFDVLLDDDTHPQNQDGEVEGIYLCDLDEVRERLHKGEFTLEAELSIYLSLAAAGLDA